MSWIGVVTNAGDALLAQWAGGSETLYITKATVGSGYVAEANMRTATALQAEKDTAAIVENKAVGNYGRKLRLRVGPNDTAGYTAHEIGLWGKLGANGTETLIQLHQDDDEGVPVPKSSESPEFVFDLIAVLATSNTASLTVNLDSSVYVTELQLEEAETELGFNPDVMKAAIMAVSGVTHVLIRLNRSNTTVDGIPAGKINVLVSGGAKASICQAIYDTNTSGLETYGTLSAEISGETISFSRVTLMPVHVRVQLQGLEEPDITDVAADIKHNIFQYINYTLNVGESLEVSRIRDLVNDGLGSLTGNIEIMDIYVSGAHGISRGIITTEWNKKFTLTATTEIELSTTTTATSDAIANTQGGLAYIVGNTNATGVSLAVGQYVYVKGHSTIPEGLRKVKGSSAIDNGDSITTNNTEAVSGGGLNELNSNIATLNSVSITFSSAVSGKISIAEGGAYYCGRLYNLSVVMQASDSIGTGELKWATLSPAPKYRISGVVIRTFDTTEIGTFQITTNTGELWVRLTTGISNTVIITLCATGFTQS